MSRQKGKMLNDFEHCYNRPDTYVGSIVNCVKQVYVVNNKGKIEFKKIKDYNPGLVHIFKEIVDNAIDNIYDSKKEGVEQTYIEISVDEETGETTVKNDGKFIYAVKENYDYLDPITNKTIVRNLYPAEAFFGYMKSGTNYDDTEASRKIGKNGMGSKATIVLSKKCVIEHTDPLHEKKLTLVFEDNLTKRTPPKVVSSKTKSGYTKFTYIPDFEKFGRKGYGKNFISLMKRIAYDVAFLTKIKVKFNGENIKVSSILNYSKLFFEDERKSMLFESKKDNTQVLMVEQTADEADMYGMRHFSFVNGNSTVEGGVHVTSSEDIIFKEMRAWWEKTKKNKLKKGDLEKYFFLFVNCEVDNPVFNAQTKQRLASPFPEKIEIKKRDFNKLKNWDFVESIMDLINSRLNREIRKNENNKTGYVGGFGSHASDANNAGKKGKEECVLFITEGQSAKQMVDQGISLLESGQDKYGTLAIKGKFLNVTNKKPENLAKNAEIVMLKKILGLHVGVDYSKDKNKKELRYQGKIVFVADADYDGIHIEGLLSNYFVDQFPKLCEENMIGKFRTPIVRIRKGKSTPTYLFSLAKYDKWLKDNDLTEETIEKGGYKVKYYKGLGTLEDEDVEYIFKNVFNFVTYTYNPKKDNEPMNLAFNNKFADKRKDWMMENIYKYKTKDNTEIQILDKEIDNTMTIPMSDFVNKIFINYAVYDNSRSIPSIFDGLKTCQRKVLYGTLMRKGNAEIKVAQLGGYIASDTHYHHGEVSLFETIIKMAQKFVGSNNINLLEGKGMFGTRHSEEKNNGAAAARYLYTCVKSITRSIFREHDESLNLLTNLYEEGYKCEYKYYVPVIPFVLVNGSEGIGVGWSTSMPNYNPLDLVEWIRVHINNSFSEIHQSYPKLVPWWKGWNGTIEELGNNEYLLCGTMHYNKKKDLYHIDELPVGFWTSKMKTVLEEMMEKKFLDYFRENHGKDTINFEVKCKSHFKLDIETNLKCMKKKVSYNNMVLLNKYGIPTKYESVEDILQEYYEERIALYVVRRKKLLKYYHNEHTKLKNKIRYITYVYNKDIDMKSFESGAELEEFLLVGNDTIKPFVKVNDSLDYLTRMLMTSMTKSNITKLENERDQIKQMHSELMNKKPQDIWLDELDEFVKHYSLKN